MQNNSTNSEISRVSKDLVATYNSIEEKVKDSSGGKMFFYVILYLVGIAISIYTIINSDLIAGKYLDSKIITDNISNAYLRNSMGQIIIYVAGCFTLVFFFILLFRIISVYEHNKIMFQKMREIKDYNKKLSEIQNVNDDYITYAENGGELDIVPANDIEETVSNINKQIGSIREKRTTAIDGILTAVFCIAAIAIGGIISIMLKDSLFSIVKTILGIAIKNGDTCKGFTTFIIDTGIVLGTIAGPFIIKMFWYEKIRMVKSVNRMIPWLFLSGIIISCIIILIATVVVFVGAILITIISFIFKLVPVIIKWIIIFAVCIIVLIIIGSMA